MLIVLAMGVSQEYYADFANWLALHGYAAITFDYRGMGHSRHGSLRGFGPTSSTGRSSIARPRPTR